MSPDIPRENIERWRARGARAVGGPYGRPRTYLGHHPTLDVVKIVDFVELDSRTPSTKRHAIQTYPLVVADEKNIDTGANFNVQVIGKFERPVSRIRFLGMPLFNPSGKNQNENPASGQSHSVTGTLAFNLIAADLSAGPFKLEDLTQAIAYQVWRNQLTPVSSLYATASNFRKPGGGPATNIAGFNLYPQFTRVDYGGGSDLTFLSPRYDPIGSAADAGAGFWFYKASGGLDFRVDGDIALWTGIHIYYAPLQPGGAGPEPSIAGEFSFVRASIRDPAGITDNDDRFPFALEEVFDVVDET